MSEETATDAAPRDRPPPPAELADAIACFDAGDLDGCTAILVRVRNATAPDVPADALLFEGLCARRAGDLTAALEALEEAARVAPDAHHILHELGLARIAAGQVQAGLDTLREAIRVSGDAPLLRHEFYLQNGVALYGEGYLEPAIASLRKALRFEKDADTYALLGHMLLEAGRLDDAVDTVREAIGHFARDAALHHIAGLALAVRREPFEAAQAFLRAVEIDPSRGDPFHSLGVCFESMGDGVRAIEAYESCLRLDCPDSLRADARDRISRLRRQMEA